IAGQNNIAIAEGNIGGKKNSRITRLTMSDPVTSQTKYYVLIYDCGTDSSVASDISDQYTALIQNGYSKIIGLRDVYPTLIAEKGKLEKGLRYSLRGKDSAYIILAVMEIEAWFMAEWNHFSKVDTRLTLTAIQTALGFNPEIDDMEERPHPSEDLDNIYKCVSRSYKKKKKQVNTIVDSLDYEFLYLEVVKSVPSFGKFVSHVDDFIKL
ncbi:MAG: hypothetical protein F6K24_50685, partial [Okeania sp. SIO2D1]|nr:hypothetical protein [Okeania sp. SIO2D1]